MSRFLAGTIAVLVALLVISRMNRPAPVTPFPGSKALAASIVHSQPAATPMAPAPLTPAPTTGTPTIDLLARLEGRRRLLRSGRNTYFDSLFIETDSVVRRWPDRGGAPFIVAVPPGDSTQYDGVLVALTRRAIDTWQGAGLGLRFTLVADTAGAQMIVLGSDQLSGQRAGQTDLLWTRDGAIHSAVITIARRDQNGTVIPDAARLAVTVHEIGHAMGLAHSGSPDDVMYQMTRTSKLSRRDRSTLSLLYELPLGTVREVVP